MNKSMFLFAVALLLFGFIAGLATAYTIGLTQINTTLQMPEPDDGPDGAPPACFES